MDPELPVGPVLRPGDVAQAVVAAIRHAHPDAEVLDRGAYLRVRVAGRCVAARSAIEASLGRSLRWPEELEAALASFAGRLRLTRDAAEWTR